MKKIILVIGVIIFSQLSFAQSSQNTRDIFCQIIVKQKFLSKKMDCRVDYGETRNYFDNTKVRDEQTGKVKSFNSQVDALNYMSEEGWTYTNSYVVSQTIGYGTTIQFYYLLKKTIPREG